VASPIPISVSKGWLVALGAMAASRAVGLVLIMGAIARALSQFANGQSVDLNLLLTLGGVGVLLRAAADWASRVLAVRSSLGLKEQLRIELVRHRLQSAGANEASGHGTAEQALLASRGLDGLDNYFREYLPSLVSAVVIPFGLGLSILLSDWLSAAILLATIPLVPVFMILIGFHTEERVAQAQAGLDRLGRHLSELARGLPVLVGLRRASSQRRVLADLSDRYRLTTLKTLRTAFLSAFTLELISTISVALIAVVIGVRLVNGNLDLQAGLFVLMLAPDIYNCLRNIGAGYHASEDGVAALNRVQAALNTAIDPEIAEQKNTHFDSGSAGRAVVVSDLTIVRGAGRETVGPVDATLEAGKVTVFAGPSGCGKSSLLGVLAGTVRGAQVQGVVAGVDPSRRALVSQAPNFFRQSAREELLASGDDQASALTLLARLLPRDRWDAPLETLSPGERRRVAISRGIARAYAVHTPASPALLLLDEPTAHLDPASARTAGELIQQAADAGITIALATHDPKLARLADGSGGYFVWQPGHRSPLFSSSTPDIFRAADRSATTDEEARAQDSQDQASLPTSAPADTNEHLTGRTEAKLTWRAVRNILPLTSVKLWFAALLGAGSVAAGAALSAVSGWLIVYASQQPPIMYLMVAIVGVRFFGLSRSILRYLERLATHDTVFTWATKIRVATWDALGANARGWSRLTRPGGAVGTLIAEIDELRDALPRVLVPVPAAVIAAIGLCVAVNIAHPAALPVVLAVAVAGIICAPLIVLLVERKSAGDAAEHRAAVAEHSARLMAAAPDVAALGLTERELTAFRSADEASNRVLKRDAIGAGIGDGLAGLVSGFGAILVIALAGPGLDSRLLALSALLLLAIEEPLGQLSDAVRHVPVLTTMLRHLTPGLENSQSAADEAAQVEDAPAIECTGVRAVDISLGYRHNTDVVTGVSGQAAPEAMWTISGPSGSGKSTVIAGLLGFLSPSRGHFELRRTGAGWQSLLDAEKHTVNGLRKSIAWCPQDGYVFDSTLAGNLALGREPGATSEKEMVDAIYAVGLGPWFDRLPDGLATLTGPSGSRISGGQRQRIAVARTLLAGSGTIILDEPTAHLGHDEGHRLIHDIESGARDRALVLVTHDQQLGQHGTCHTTLEFRSEQLR
jgi:ATP-binding cassette subfamily C protein CydCD